MLLPTAGVHPMRAVVFVMMKLVMIGAGAAGCGVADATAESALVPIWLIALTLKKYVVPFFKLGTFTVVRDEPLFGIATVQGPFAELAIWTV